MKKFDLNFYSGKRVLVTGHTGFKGTWLCRLLLNMGGSGYRIFAGAAYRTIRFWTCRHGQTDEQYNR